ncbi:MAG: hypothetical protein IPM24_02230 [Bryobacterales bacterium]|nr:hypothetical protein [Bryobacterales bacterium]
MPRRNRKVRATVETHGKLTYEQRSYLLFGGRSPFPDSATAERAWRTHRAHLMSLVNPCTRPFAWWTFESPVVRQMRRPASEQLAELGLLTPEELEIERRRKERIKQ